LTSALSSALSSPNGQASISGVKLGTNKQILEQIQKAIQG
jgi:hypothetical protein